MYGSESRPVRAGSMPSKTPALVPVSVTRAARSSESHCIRWLDPRRDVVERVVVGELQPRPLDELVPPEDVDVLRASLVARAGNGARRVLHPEVGGDSEDLTRLEVRAEADQEIGEAVDILRVVAHGAGTLHWRRPNPLADPGRSERATCAEVPVRRRRLAPQGGRADQGRPRARQRRAGRAEHVRRVDATSSRSTASASPSRSSATCS